jgi:hypothetical protein
LYHYVFDVLLVDKFLGFKIIYKTDVGCIGWQYVREELNVLNIVPCSDLLKYASLRAEPDYRYVSADLRILFADK